MKKSDETWLDNLMTEYGLDEILSTLRKLATEHAENLEKAKDNLFCSEDAAKYRQYAEKIGEII